MIQNPILPGFNPDPSICRVGDDYYIATSTFEWFPGVSLHHSRDLVHWRMLRHPLERLSQLDLRGCPHSAGVWAPCLSHDGERFWLIYTNTRHWGAGWWDSPNYLVTAEDINGPWSEPVFLNASGFDPSLFHDEDGRKWLLNMRWDGRPGHPDFSGIEMQEYVHGQGLIGAVQLIWSGSGRGITEGPHIYKRDGFYYLVCAEGGTGHGHCVAVARSRDLAGPYETHPDTHILHAPRDEQPSLYKCGHASFVQAGDGSWWMPHLCGRPLPSPMPGDEIEGNRYCPLGRETAMQRLDWPAGDWPRLAGGGSLPRLQWPAPDLPAHPWPRTPDCDVFDGAQLPVWYQSLREPITDDWCNLRARPGWLRLRGRSGLDGLFNHSLVARRVEHHAFHAHCRIDCRPRDWKQRAGLIIYYDRSAYRFLAITCDDDGRRMLVMDTADRSLGGGFKRPHQLALPEADCFDLACDADGSGGMRFSWRPVVGQAEGPWQSVGDADALTRISDEHAREGRFTGAFIGMAACDQRYYNAPADFRHFAYRPALTAH